MDWHRTDPSDNSSVSRFDAFGRMTATSLLLTGVVSSCAPRGSPRGLETPATSRTVAPAVDASAVASAPADAGNPPDAETQTDAEAQIIPPHARDAEPSLPPGAIVAPKAREPEPRDRVLLEGLCTLRRGKKVECAGCPGRPGPWNDNQNYVSLTAVLDGKFVDGVDQSVLAQFWSECFRMPDTSLYVRKGPHWSRLLLDLERFADGWCWRLQMNSDMALCMTSNMKLMYSFVVLDFGRLKQTLLFGTRDSWGLKCESGFASEYYLGTRLATRAVWSQRAREEVAVVYKYYRVVDMDPAQQSKCDESTTPESAGLSPHWAVLGFNHRSGHWALNEDSRRDAEAIGAYISLTEEDIKPDK